LARHVSKDEFNVLYEKHYPTESDQSVCQEWTTALETTDLEL
jgi:hypothetical protein